MKLNNFELYDFLKEKGILQLYHANTVATSISFFQAGGLLSRGDIEKNGLFQTSQSSDEKDRRFDVWDDIFLDTVDLHRFFNRQNAYGPVLFVINIEFLLKDEVDIWITKNNPVYWDSRLSDVDKYFQDVVELRTKWESIERQRKMITIRKPNKIMFFSSLDKIIVDDPNMKIFDDIQVFNEVEKALLAATKNLSFLTDKFNVRKCCSCYCAYNYLNEVPLERVAKFFLPKEHAFFSN